MSRNNMTHPAPCLIFLFFLQLTATSNPYAAEGLPIHIAANRAKNNPDSLLAHQLLQNKSLDAARDTYEKILTNEAHNLDALLALASLSEHQGKHQEAFLYLEKAQASDPLDAATQAMRLGYRENNPSQSESRLKILLSQQAHSAPLHFALGNIFSRQKRWPEAQAAYFNALAADTGNPDYLCNLAISLDHLNQDALAKDHYRRALTAAESRPASFNPLIIEQRLNEITP